MVVNTNHKPSISRNPATPQPQLKPRAGARAVLAALALGAGALPAWAAENGSCVAALGTPAVRQGPLRTLGTTPVSANLALSPGHTYLIEVEERDNDALVEVLDPAGKVVASADHPEQRTGTRRVVVAAPTFGNLEVRTIGKEAGVTGTATISAFDLAHVEGRSDCLALITALADADREYATGQEIAWGRAGITKVSAHDAFQHAADKYRSAEQAAGTSGDRALRGETQLALASIDYISLQEWAKTVEDARSAIETLGAADPYRRARAEALVAMAWIEIGRGVPTPAAAGSTASPTDLLTHARATLERLVRLHRRRGDTYDAGYQTSNVALTYYYQGRFAECVGASKEASRLFAAIADPVRLSQTWQNTALCLWGLGHLSEALQFFRRALAGMGPQTYPATHVTILNNTALLDYALRDFDESLELFDRALSIARQTQRPRDEGQSLYGLGLDYYALGDPAKAREYLERSLAIRSVSLDRRGRMTTLRALATLDGDEGRLDEAVKLDHEALELAAGSASTERVTVQLAVHIAAAGHLDEAKALLDNVAVNGTYRLAQADALLQRGVLLREMGRPREGLADLAAAGQRFNDLDDVTEEFTATFELARSERLLGEPRAALKTVDRALGWADAIRTQSANPEFRSQLQAPLRAAYELKIELLRSRYEDARASGRVQEMRALAIAAFATADTSRARTLSDVSDEQYPPAVRRGLAADLRHRERLYQELAGRRYVMQGRLDRVDSKDPHVQQLMSDIVELQRQLDTLNALIARRATGPHSAAAGRVFAVPAIPAATALVSYWLGTDSAYAWVVLPREIHWARLRPTQEIKDAAGDLYHSMTQIVAGSPEQRLSDARRLYDLILQPLEPWLDSVQQWVIIPDGALDYVPFSALRASTANGGAFVVAQHDVAYTPAGWMLGRTNRPAIGDDGDLLLVADPVYEAGDLRLTAEARANALARTPARSLADVGRNGYHRLPFTAEEAKAIAALMPSGRVALLTGFAASRDRLLALDWSKFRFIHFATHGVVDAQVPELSALMLSAYDSSGNPVDGAVRVADLSVRTFRADVAVFSACDTAIGKEMPSEGLVGISSTVLARGARAVVASLWPVSDEIGASLMTEFYRHLLHDSDSPVAALGAAMRSVASRDGSVDPALWASFQVSVAVIGRGQPIRDATRAATTRP